MSDALCQCGHAGGQHVAREWDCYVCGSDTCTAFTPPPTREPIRLTAIEGDEIEALADEFAAAVVHNKTAMDELNALFAGVESILAARLAGGPTLADARTPESEDRE